MNKKNIIKILMVITLIGTIFPYSPILAQEEDYYSGVIQPDWLYFDVEDMNLNDNLRFTQGGVSLVNFENLGIYEDHPESNSIIFAGKLTFTAQSQMYTACTPYSIFPDIDTLHKNQYEFLYHGFRNHGFLTSYRRYHTTFNSIDKGDTFNPNYYYEQVPISVGLNPDFDSLAGTEIKGIQVSDSSYTWEVHEVKVNDLLFDKVGDYEVNFTLPEDTSVQITAVSQQDEPSDNDAYSYTTKNNLGCTITDTFNTPVQTEIRDTKPIGNRWSNTNPGIFTFNDFIELQPKVDLLQHQVSTRHISIDSNYIIFVGWNTYITKGLTTYDSDITSEEFPHIISGIIVNNWFAWKTYQIEINVLATVSLTAQEYSESLDNPIFEQGDWVWNIHQGGITQLELVEPADPLGPLFGGLFGLIGTIITVILVVVGVKYIAYPILSRKNSN